MMKKCLLLIGMSILGALTTIAKETGDSIPQLSVNKNYIYSQTLLDPTGEHVKSEVNYFDGIGRASQQVTPFVTPSGADLALYQEYDSLGDLWKEWLPAIAVGNKGGFVEEIPEKLPEQYGDVNPYSSLHYEHCPLNRILERHGPGMDWPYYRIQGTNFWTNRSEYPDLTCKCYEIEGDSLVCNSDYETGELYLTQQTDEDEKTTYIFTDKLNRTVLTRQVSSPRYDATCLDTYYVYDALNNLCFVLSPGFQENPDLDLYSYQYKFDARNRCIGKKTPGTDWITYAFDKAGHLIFSQDGAQRQRRELTYHLSDELGREVIVGVGTLYSDTIPDISNTHIKAVRYDHPGATGAGYLVYNLLGLTTTIPLTVNYYDSYSFLNMDEEYKNLLEYSFEDLPASKEYETYFKSTTSLQQSAKGMLTGTFVNIPDLQKGVMTAIYYDDKKNIIQSRSTNHLDGYDKNWFSYSYSGLKLKHLHVHDSRYYKSLVTEMYEYSYDHATRLKQVDHTLNDAPRVTLATYTYDELGRLSQKTLHNGQFTQSYTYNIRNWLKSISSPYFEQQLYYTENEVGNTPQYNGNIGSMIWKVRGESKRGYNFAYDNFNRLANADYQENELPSPHYSTRYSYNFMGDLTRISRNGLLTAGSEPTFGETDRLFLIYHGNQLKQVTDSADLNISLSPGSLNFTDGVNLAEEYKYDKSGNLIQDLNKGIEQIKYNSLNLPDTVIVDKKHCIYYRYGGEGSKFQVIHKDSIENVTDYCGNVLYDNNVLHKVLTEEGFVTFENGVPVYHYFLQDHQGNNRMVIRQDGVTEEVNHYYPFGGLFGESTGMQKQAYKYNGKELDTNIGLNWYDYGARHYDAALGRWNAVDPMAEKRYGISPYSYTSNNPVNRIDINGQLDDWVESAAKRIYWDSNATSQATTKPGETYLGKTVVDFSGSRQEALGIKNGKSGYINGEGAVTAQVTVYGAGGSDDVHNFTGYTMSSDAKTLGAIDEGIYNGNYDAKGKSGSLKSHWVLNNRGSVRTLDGQINPNAPKQINPNGEGYKDQIFIHSTNRNGFAGTKGNIAISKGCLLISPKDWNSFNNVMDGTQNFKVRVSRTTIEKSPLQGVTGAVNGVYIINKRTIY
ncbi:RHS repeat domain-containing protein [Bacteroides sp. GM023]|uniref:RHS repeat domain-containing protein n=1 Tax=Bacteroides sp. GM023 TaxID=2723058 RepID=UPI001CC2B775|nr:RHS repeat-associated core domain-containing protein [Bacteroides sp. GM023]